MSVRLPTEHHLEFQSSKGGCTSSSIVYICQNTTMLEITSPLQKPSAQVKGSISDVNELILTKLIGYPPSMVLIIFFYLKCIKSSQWVFRYGSGQMEGRHQNFCISLTSLGDNNDESVSLN